MDENENDPEQKIVEQEDNAPPEVGTAEANNAQKQRDKDCHVSISMPSPTANNNDSRIGESVPRISSNKPFSNKRAPTSLRKPQISLAEMWGYPASVNRSFAVYPLLNRPAGNILAKARKKSAQLRHQLEKEPEHHRLSVDSRRSSRGAGRSANAPNKYSAENRSRSLNAGMPNRPRKPRASTTSTHSMFGHHPQFKSKQSIHTVNVDASNPPDIVGAIREHHEDKKSGDVAQLWRTYTRHCRRNCRRCMKSPRFTCVIFTIVAVVVTVACVIVILYPIYRLIHDMYSVPYEHQEHQHD